MTKFEIYKQKLRCLFGRHEFEVDDHICALTADMRCKHCPKTWQVPVTHIIECQLATNLEFKHGYACFEVFRNDKQILYINYDRSGCIKQGKTFIDLGAKLASLVYDSSKKKPLKKGSEPVKKRKGKGKCPPKY